MSGLPVNTFAQAAEYRKRYLASLALSAQNDAFNLQANQVYRQTGQPSRPPDTRSTTEKLADLERIKVDLRSGFMEITDGTNANEAIEQLTPDEIIFASQQLPAIIADIKPRFRSGVPANALLIFLRALRKKFLQTNGVSFTAQEATAQQILNAIQAGVNFMGANGGPFSVTGSSVQEEEPQEFTPEGDENATPPQSPDPAPPQSPAPAPAPRGSRTRDTPMVMDFKNDKRYKQAATKWTPTQSEWERYPVAGGFSPFPDKEEIAVAFLKMWASSQDEDMGVEYENVKSLKTLKNRLTSLAASIGKWGSVDEDVFGINVTSSPAPPAPPRSLTNYSMLVEAIGNIPEAELLDRLEQWNNNRSGRRPIIFLPTGDEINPDNIDLVGIGGIPVEETNLEELFAEEARKARAKGKGLKTGFHRMPDGRIMKDSEHKSVGMGMRRLMEPVSRYPKGREILGYGLVAPRKKERKPIQVDMTKGLSYESSPYFVSFGKYVINPSKLASGIIDLKTRGGSKINKYPQRQLSAGLSKVMNRMIGGRMPDEYDFNEMDLEDQNFLYNLASDAKINDRLKLKTPKRSKDGEEQNRFEILKGQIIAGNDNKDLVKEFKQMLLRFSNDGRIKKSEAREILLDLVALGH